MWTGTRRAFTFSNTRKHQWKTKCRNPIAVVWVLASHMLLNALIDLRHCKTKEIALPCSALPKVCKHRGNLLSAKQRLLRWPKLGERHLFLGNLLHHSNGRPQFCTNDSPYRGKPQGFIGLVPCMCVHGAAGWGTCTSPSRYYRWGWGRRGLFQNQAGVLRDFTVEWMGIREQTETFQSFWGMNVGRTLCQL